MRFEIQLSIELTCSSSKLGFREKGRDSAKATEAEAASEAPEDTTAADQAEAKVQVDLAQASQVDQDTAAVLDSGPAAAPEVQVLASEVRAQVLVDRLTLADQPSPLLLRWFRPADLRVSRPSLKTISAPV